MTKPDANIRARRTVAWVGLLALSLLLAGSLQSQDGLAPNSPDRAEVGDWRDQSRPGYRAQPTPSSVAFYRYVMDKAARGEPLSRTDRWLVYRMIASRTWPEAPELTARDETVRQWLLQQPEDARLFTDPDGWSRGMMTDAVYERLVAAGLTIDDTPPTVVTERFRVYWTGLTPEQRAELPVGEWMYRAFVRQGYDMRSDEQRSQDAAYTSRQEELRRAGLKEQAEAERQRKEAAEADERQRQKWFEDNWAKEDRRIAREQAEVNLVWAEYIAFFTGLTPAERAHALAEMNAEQRDELQRRLPQPAGAAPAAAADDVAGLVSAGVTPPDAARIGDAPQGAAIVVSAAAAEASRIESQRAFRVIVPSIWAGAADARSFIAKRTAAKGGAVYEMCPYPAEVYGEVNGKVNPSFGPRTSEEIRAKLEAEAAEHRKWGREPELRPFVIGAYSGFLLETRMRFARGGWSHSGYRDSATEALGHGWVTSAGRTFEVSYGIGSGGCWDNSQRAFQESQTLAAQREAQAILAGLRLVPEASLTQVPYTGPALDGSDLPVVRLDPAGSLRVAVGDTVIIRAVVDRLTPADRPLSFEWTGEHEGAGAEVLIRATEPGSFNLAVTVLGARYALGTAALKYEVTPAQPKPEHQPPAARPARSETPTSTPPRAKVPVKAQPIRGYGTAGTERWQVRLDPGPYFSTFELKIAADGTVEGVSHWTCCSGPVNRITGRMTPDGEVELTRHLEGAHTGMSHTWKGHYSADRKTLQGTWSSGQYMHGQGPWSAEVEAFVQPGSEHPASAVGPARAGPPTTWVREESLPVPVISCGSTGQVCAPPHSSTFEGAGELWISYTAGPLHCSDVAVRIRIDELPEQQTGFVSAGQTTEALRFMLPGGTHKLVVTGVGRAGGCNTGVMLGWTGSVTLKWASQ